MIVTTNIDGDNFSIKKAQKIAKDFSINYVERKKKTLKSMLLSYDKIFVVYKEKLVYLDKNTKLFFHPDSAMFRVKSKYEPLIDIIGKNKRVLDATMGLASDSIVLSFFDNEVTSLESQKIIYYIVKDGLKNYTTNNEKFNSAMKKIKCINIDNLEYLKKQKEKSFDIIYFDPMFSFNIKESKNLEHISEIANFNQISKQLIKEAKRVAKEKIIIKAHFKDDVFEKFNFTRLVRKNTKFHYGYIKIK